MSNLESRHPDDAVPPAQGREPFPLGDIDMDTFFKMDNKLYKLNLAWNKADYHSTVRNMALEEEELFSTNESLSSVAAGYEQLAEAWPAAFGIRPFSRGRRLINRTLFSTHSFIRDVLPPIQNNFDKDFELMARFSDTEVGDFAVEAEVSMRASHPELHKLLNTFGNMFASRTCKTEEEYFLVKACVALPYVLSSNSRLMELSQQEAA